MRNVFKDISGVYNLNANKPALFNYDEENHKFRHWEPEKSLSGVNPETNEEVIFSLELLKET